MKTAYACHVTLTLEWPKVSANEANLTGMYFDFREGRPTAASVAEKLGIPVATVRDWLADHRNGELLDEIVPLWPNIGSARQFASGHVPEALQMLVELMRSSTSEKVRQRKL